MGVVEVYLIVIFVLYLLGEGATGGGADKGGCGCLLLILLLLAMFAGC